MNVADIEQTQTMNAADIEQTQTMNVADIELFKRLFGADPAKIEQEEVLPILDLTDLCGNQIQLKHQITGWVRTKGVRHRFSYIGRLDGVHRGSGTLLFQEHIDVGYVLSRVAKFTDEELSKYEFKLLKD